MISYWKCADCRPAEVSQNQPSAQADVKQSAVTAPSTFKYKDNVIWICLADIKIRTWPQPVDVNEYTCQTYNDSASCDKATRGPAALQWLCTSVSFTVWFLICHRRSFSPALVTLIAANWVQTETHRFIGWSLVQVFHLPTTKSKCY